MRALLICAVAVGLAGCGDPKTICGVEYETYGFFTKDEKKDPNIKYELVMGNVIWSVVTIETVALPVYFIGFSLFEPVAAKTACP